MGWGASRGIWREGLRLREFAGKWFGVRRGEYRDGWSLSESDLKNIVGWSEVTGAYGSRGEYRAMVCGRGSFSTVWEMSRGGMRPREFVRKRLGRGLVFFGPCILVYARSPSLGAGAFPLCDIWGSVIFVAGWCEVVCRQASYKSIKKKKG